MSRNLLFDAMREEYARSINNPDVDINGLVACPDCNHVGEVRLQTPPDDDNVVRQVFFRCFHCHTCSPKVPGWKPTPLGEVGSSPWQPLKEFFNEWAEETRNVQGEV